MEPSHARDKVHLRRSLELYHGIAILCGVVIGAGIYISPQSVLQHAGSPVAALICWAVSGVLATISALAMAELGTTYPASGGMYEYLLQMYGPYVGYQYMWIYMFFVRPGFSSLKCLLFSRILLQVIFGECPAPEDSVILLAIALACLLMFLNYMSVMSSALSQVVTTALSIAALVIISTNGLNWVISDRTNHMVSGFSGSSHEAVDYVFAVYGAMVAYIGGNLPLAIIVSMTIITVLYLLVNAAYFIVLSPDIMLHSTAVSVTFSTTTMAQYGWIMPAFIAITTAGSCNSSFLIGSRLCFAAARRDHLPGVFSLIHIDRRTPVTAILQQCTSLVLAIWIGNFDWILSNVMSLIILSELIASIGILYLRWKQPNMIRPNKMPMIIPVVFFLSSLFLFLIPIIKRPSSVGVGLLLGVGSGTIAYLFGVKWQNKPACITNLHVNLMMLMQKLLYAVREEKYVP